MISTEYKYKMYVDRATGKIKKIVFAKNPGGLDVSNIALENWWQTNIQLGSTIKIGKYVTAKVVGEATVKDVKGRQWVCWKAVNNEGTEYYYDKATGLPIKLYCKRIQGGDQIEVLLLLKDTNIVSSPTGFLGILGYVTIGEISIPVLLLLIIITVIVVLIIVLIVVLRRGSPPPPPPAPYPAQPAYSTQPPPPPQQQVTPVCPSCGQPLTWIP